MRTQTHTPTEVGLIWTALEPHSFLCALDKEVSHEFTGQISSCTHTGFSITNRNNQLPEPEIKAEVNLTSSSEATKKN